MLAFQHCRYAKCWRRILKMLTSQSVVSVPVCNSLHPSKYGQMRRANTASLIAISTK